MSMRSLEYMVVENRRTGLFNVFLGDMNDPETWQWKAGQFNTEEEAKEAIYHLEMEELSSSYLR